MVRCHRWTGSALVLLWVWGWFLGGIALGGAVEPGKEAYQKRCQSCHGADGKGNPQMEKTLKVPIPPVTGEALGPKDDAEMLKIIADGQGKMPGYAKPLSAEEQRQVLMFMKKLGQP